MNNAPDPHGVDGALADGDGYVLLPLRLNGNPGDAVVGFDAAGGTWTTLHDFSGLSHANSPAFFHADTPAAQLRATLTGSAGRVEVRAFPHAGPRSAAVLDNNGAFTNVTKPAVAAGAGPALLAALVTLGLVVDDT